MDTNIFVTGENRFVKAEQIFVTETHFIVPDENSFVTVEQYFVIKKQTFVMKWDIYDKVKKAFKMRQIKIYCNFLNILGQNSFLFANFLP